MSSPPSGSHGHLPPQNIEAEERVLGAMMLDTGVIMDVVAEVRAEDFYKLSHRLIFQAICSIHSTGDTADIITVSDALKRSGQIERAGGPEYVARLADGVSTARSAASHAKLVRNAAVLRNLMHAANAISERALVGETDAAAILRDALGAIEEISNSGTGGGKWEIVTAYDLRAMALDPPTELVRSVLTLGNVGFIGGEPKMRKSWIACDLALSVSSGGKFLERFDVPLPGPVVFVEEEDHKYRMDQRLHDLWRHRTPESALPMPNNIHLLIRQGIKLDDASHFSRLSNIIGNIKPVLVIFDSLTRIHNLKTNLDSDIKPVLDAIDRIARVHNCACLTIHHYSKVQQGGPSRGGQRLRGSGDIHARSENSLYVMSATNDGQIVETESKDYEGQRLLMQFEASDDMGARLWATPLEVTSTRVEKARDFIFQAIASLSPLFSMADGHVPFQKLVERTGKSEPTLRSHCRALAEQGRIEMSSGGRGSKNPWVKLPSPHTTSEQPPLAVYDDAPQPRYDADNPPF